MKKVIIIAVTPSPEGVTIETNIPAKLKTLNVKGTISFVSWDKIGSLLFENYTDEVVVSNLRSLRSESQELQ